MQAEKILPVVTSVLIFSLSCIGFFIGVTNRNSKEDPAISPNSETVAAVCAPTDYKEVCFNSVGPAADDERATPERVVHAAINAAILELQGAMNKSGSMFRISDPAQKMAKEDCYELLNFAVKELQASAAMVGSNELKTLNGREAEVKNWLSAVMSYQEACLDGITQPDLKNQMSYELLNATKLTSNALAMVSSISRILDILRIPYNDTATASSQRISDASETGYGDYPEWLSAPDRKLLASQNNAKMPPNAVVAQDGSGQYKTIGAALAAYPKNLRGRYVIYVKAGIYNESIRVTKDQVNVFMYGDGTQKTIIIGRKSKRDGVSTYQSASFSAVGNGFIAKSMGFLNTAGPEGNQAVALQVQSDKSAFYNCRMDGYQGTLYAQTHRQFYRNCIISGTVDFIFGDAAAVIQNSLIIARKPMDNQKNTVTAQGRTDIRETTGLVIQNCRIVPEQTLFPLRFQIPTYLGRPWKLYSRTIIMESTLGDFIQPAGWLKWNGNFALDTLYFAEYANKGPGAATNKRVKWAGFHVITDRNEALQYTAGTFIQGNLWLKDTGGPYLLSLKI